MGKFEQFVDTAKDYIDYHLLVRNEAEKIRVANQFVQEYIPWLATRSNADTLLNNFHRANLKKTQRHMIDDVTPTMILEDTSPNTPHIKLLWGALYNMPVRLRVSGQDHSSRKSHSVIDTLILPEAPGDIRDEQHLRRLLFVNGSGDPHISFDQQIIQMSGKDHIYAGSYTFQHRPFHSWIRMTAHSHDTIDASYV